MTTTLRWYVEQSVTKNSLAPVSTNIYFVSGFTSHCRPYRQSYLQPFGLTPWSRLTILYTHWLRQTCRTAACMFLLHKNIYCKPSLAIKQTLCNTSTDTTLPFMHLLYNGRPKEQMADGHYGWLPFRIICTWIRLTSASFSTPSCSDIVRGSKCR